MIQITDQECKQLRKRFPKTAQIVASKHHSFLMGYDTSEEVRFLFSLRGKQQPHSRRQLSRERLGDRYGHMFSELSRNRRP